MKLYKSIRPIKILFVGVFIGLIGLYFTFSPQKELFFPHCPFLQFTGWQCPGCGSQRAIHCLLHFNLAEAFKYNQLLVVSIPYILLGIYLNYLGGQTKFPKLRKRLYGQEACYLILIIIALFFLSRNLL